MDLLAMMNSTKPDTPKEPEPEPAAEAAPNVSSSSSVSVGLLATSLPGPSSSLPRPPLPSTNSSFMSSSGQPILPPISTLTEGPSLTNVTAITPSALSEPPGSNNDTNISSDTTSTSATEQTHSSTWVGDHSRAPREDSEKLTLPEFNNINTSTGNNGSSTSIGVTGNSSEGQGTHSAAIAAPIATHNTVSDPVSNTVPHTLLTDSPAVMSSTNNSLPDRAEDAVARLKKSSSSALEDSADPHATSTTTVITSTASPGPESNYNKNLHHHHYHHHHHHHHHHGRNRSMSSALGLVAPTLHDLDIKVNNNAVLEAVKDLPRHNLGTIVYTFKFHDELLLPRLDGKENSLLTVRIPNRMLTKNNYGVVKRKLWGTDVYTDDSDVVAALYHNGYLKGLNSDLPSPKRLKMIDNEVNKGAGDGAVDGEQQEQEEADKDNEKNSGSGSPEERDCIVTLLILPKLTLYRGSYRNGLNSRTWKTQHDGASFMIHKVEFVARGEAENVPLLKKARLNEWNDGRKWTVQTYPRFHLDQKLVERLLNKDVPAVEGNGTGTVEGTGTVTGAETTAAVVTAGEA